MQSVRLCSVNGGVWDQKTYDAALKEARASGRPMCQATGLVGPCVTWPEKDGYCHWHRHSMYRQRVPTP